MSGLPRAETLLDHATCSRRPGTKPELVKQPIQHRYTIREAKAGLQRHPLKVVDVLHARRPARPPLDLSAVVYIAERRGRQ